MTSVAALGIPMTDLIQAIADVGRGHAQRIVKPGVWRVWRVGGALRLVPSIHPWHVLPEPTQELFL
jgi:hypothetical protein